MFVRKVLSPNISWYLNKISTSQTLLSFGYGGLKLDILIIYFMISDFNLQMDRLEYEE